MNGFILTLNAFIKGLIIASRPHIFLGWLRRPLQTSTNLLSLTKWIASQNTTGIMNDFYTYDRDYSRRYTLYQQVLDSYQLATENVDYLEFGVCGGSSFQWWVENITHPQSTFYGFDTFEGLPESWGVFNKGDMSADVPQIDDTRVHFIKGLFQDSLPGFLADHQLNNGKRKIIHLDADLFSSTLYALTSLAPYIKKGDILFFDEFNVPNHEFLAFKMFCDSYYVKTKLLGAVNNYYQVAMMIE